MRDSWQQGIQAVIVICTLAIDPYLEQWLERDCGQGHPVILIANTGQKQQFELSDGVQSVFRGISKSERRRQVLTDTKTSVSRSRFVTLWVIRVSRQSRQRRQM